MNKTAADFNSSAEARAAGFSTLAWLRAKTFNEHVARIERDRATTDKECTSE